MVARFRALLIGIAEYDDARIQDLPFVRDDITDLTTTLEAAGYAVELFDGGGRGSKPKIFEEVREFVLSGAKQDHLLVYLSGHGVGRHGGLNYLVPSEAVLRLPQMYEHCLRIDGWTDEVVRSSAASVVFLVDACRDGFGDASIGISTRVWWSHTNAEVIRRSAGYVFACRAGQTARYVGDETGRTYSLFASALRTVVTSAAEPMTFNGFRRALSRQMTRLVNEHGGAQQTPSFVSSPDNDELLVLPGRSALVVHGDHPLIAMVRNHEAWAHVADHNSLAQLREDTLAIMREYAEDLLAHETALADVENTIRTDHWIRPGFLYPTIDRTDFLLKVMLPDLKLSPAEAVLLATAPVLHHMYQWLSFLMGAFMLGATKNQDQLPDVVLAAREAFARFYERYGHLRRRAVTLAEKSIGSADEIGGWLIYRWMLEQGDMYDPDGDIMGLLLEEPPRVGRLIREILSADRMAELFRCLQANPSFLADSDRSGALREIVKVAPSTVNEQQLRERMVLYLLAVAQGLAIEPIRLPNVVVQNLGTADGVSLDELHETLDGAVWDQRGNLRVLRAWCTHPAIHLALREHVGYVDELLAEVQRAGHSETTLAPLVTLPARASADQVQTRSANMDYVTPSAGIRFRLANDRVQELLMGEQLYGDKMLAVRELYQNALDACRHRRARLAYLKQTKGVDSAWAGKITFSQGNDEDGRPYLECQDNGVGMGVRELAAAFSEAGTRFSDLTEYQEERADWAKLDGLVQLFPNSRFGIGALSYFMLADEITVETCRMNRDGSIGELFRVQIAGPGTLFRVRSRGIGTQPGTTVRLHLRSTDTPSCVDFLRSNLLVAEFGTTATHTDESQTWPPDVLSTAAEKNQTNKDPRYTPPVLAVLGELLWWCADDGTILADGLWAGKTTFGAIIDLRGEHAPVLSVNRTGIQSYDIDEVNERLIRGAENLAASGPPVLTQAWLAQLASGRPAIADAVFDAAVEAGQPDWEVNGQLIEIAYAGCYSGDTQLVRAKARDSDDPAKQPFTRGRSTDLDLSDHTIDWRLTALAAAGLYRQTLGSNDDWLDVVRARPSDATILKAVSSFRVDAELPLGLLIAAAVVCRSSIGEGAQRLRELGYRIADSHLNEDGHPDPFDTLIMSRDLDRVGPWLDIDRPVPPVRLVRTASKAGRSVVEVAQRLRVLGYDTAVDPALITATGPLPEDAAASLDFDGKAPWLDAAEEVPGHHIVAAAVSVRRTAQEVRDRLTALGYRVSAEPDNGLTDDAIIISRQCDGKKPWLSPASPIRVNQLSKAARAIGGPVSYVVQRLTLLGHTVSTPHSITIDEDDPDDERITDGCDPWLSTEIPLAWLVIAAGITGRAIAEVATRLALLGYPVPAGLGPVGIGRPDPDDIALLSEHLDGREPWIDIHQPIPVLHLVEAASRTSQGIDAVIDRLSILGCHVWHRAERVTAQEVRADDRLLLWTDLDPAQPLLLAHLVISAARAHRRIDYAAQRLTALGNLIPADLSPIGTDLPRPADVELVSRDLDGQSPWLEPKIPTRMMHIVEAAHGRGQSAEAVADRLRELGYAVPDIADRLPRLRPGPLATRRLE